MLRPATPLSILLFVAFVLLLLSVISTPIVKGIPLATFDGIDFGVFGHCKGSSCSGPQVGYSTGESMADREHTETAFQIMCLSWENLLDFGGTMMSPLFGPADFTYQTRRLSLETAMKTTSLSRPAPGLPYLPSS